MEEVIAIVAIAITVPLTAIIGSYILKYKQIHSNAISPEEKQMIAEMIRENKDLKSRVNNLEAIVSEVDVDLLRIEAHTKSDLERGLAKMKQKDKIKQS